MTEKTKSFRGIICYFFILCGLRF